MRVAQPLVASAVTWAGPRVLGAAYRAGTGRTPPTIRSSRYSVLSRVAWSMAVAGLVALTEALILQAIGGHDSDGPDDGSGALEPGAPLP